MEKEKPLKRGARSNDWANEPRLKELFPKLAKALTEDRRDSVKRMEKLGLPRAKNITTDLASFLENPEEYFAQVPPGKYYISINPYDPGKKDLKRCGEADLNREEVMKFIEANIQPGKYDLFEIKLEEYANKYGGTIVIGGKNEIWVEFKKGTQVEIGSGTAAPEYIVRQDRHTGVMRYSFDDENLRQAIYNTIQSIPHKGEAFKTEYTPGYYEFALFDRNGKLQPIFFDYNPNPELQPDWKRQGDNHPKRDFNI